MNQDGSASEALPPESAYDQWAEEYVASSLSAIYPDMQRRPTPTPPCRPATPTNQTGDIEKLRLMRKIIRWEILRHDPIGPAVGHSNLKEPRLTCFSAYFSCR